MKAKQTGITMGLIRDDIRTTRLFITEYRLHKNKYIKNQAAFWLYQTIELLILIQLFTALPNLDQSLYINNNLIKLHEFVSSLQINYVTPQRFKGILKEVSTWQTAGYNPNFKAQITTLESVHNMAYQWYKELYNSGIR